MLITCPQCQTVFNVPDAVYKPGRKARCTVCSHIFPMPDLTKPAEQGTNAPTDYLAGSAQNQSFSAEHDLPGQLHGASLQYAAPNLQQDAGFGGDSGVSMMPPSPPQRSKAIYIAAMVCVLALAVGVYFFFFASHTRGINDPKDIVAEQISDFDKIKNIALLGLKQYYVDNERMGPLVVIEGYARNDFDTPKSYITVEAQLYDSKGKVVATEVRRCGVQLAPVQLSVLGKDDMLAALRNQFEILATNVNVKPGAETPFMIVFMFPPTNIAKFAVRVVDVSDSPEPPVAGSK